METLPCIQTVQCKYSAFKYTFALHSGAGLVHDISSPHQERYRSAQARRMAENVIRLANNELLRQLRSRVPSTTVAAEAPLAEQQPLRKRVSRH